MSQTLAERIRLTQAFQSKSFTLLWLGQTISFIGNAAYTTALAWQVLILTGSGTAMSVVIIAQSIPRSVCAQHS